MTIKLSLEPVWMKVARTYLGVARGTLHKNPKVIEFYAEADHPEIKDDHVSWCFTGETEILTESGWIRFDELGDSERVYQSDENGGLSLTIPLRKIDKDYSGYLFDVNHRSVKLSCDTGHRWFGYWGKRESPSFGTLDRIPSDGLSIPSVHSTELGSALSRDQLWLLAAFISDGNYLWNRGKRSGSPWSIAIQVSKQRKVETLQSLQPDHVYTQKHVYGTRTVIPLTTFRFEYPEFFDQTFDGYKLLSRGFINSLSREQAIEFLDAYAKFDGNDGENAIKLYVSDRQMRDDLVTLSVLAGYLPSVQSEKVSPISGNPNWTVVFSKNKEVRHLRQKHITSRFFEGKLYCVEVPTGLIVVRGINGSPTLSGNCAAFVGAVLHECKLPHTGTLLALDYSNPKYVQLLHGPVIGAIFTMHRPGFPGAGHTGFVADFDDTHISSLGGNQSAIHKVCIDRIARSEINSYAWPLGVKLPV